MNTNEISNKLEFIFESCRDCVKDNYVAVEGLAGAGKSTLIGELKKFEHQFVDGVLFLPELNLPEWAYKTEHYLEAEKTRKEILSTSDYILLNISDRSILSTIMVAAAKELSNLNMKDKNWDILLDWFSYKINLQFLFFPKYIIYVKASVETTIERQLNRQKYRNLESFFLNDSFCYNSEKIYELCLNIIESKKISTIITVHSDINNKEIDINKVIKSIVKKVN